MSDYTRIYLQPECCADEDTGRLWCQDDGPQSCPDGEKWTPYILASEYNRLQAENEALRARVAGLVEALERLVGDVERATHVEFGGTPWLKEKMAEIDYARAALAAYRKGGEVCLSDYEALQAENEKLRKDAERYRHIREGNQWVVAATQTGFHVDGEQLDELIDAEMETNHDWR